MKLHTLKPATGSTKVNKRRGRGQGTGSADTAGRGHKGQKSVSGYNRRVGFEGGQMPLQRRVPKFGFRNINRVEYKGVNLDTIQKLVDEGKLKEVNFDILREYGLVGKRDLIKILGRGELKSGVKISAHKFSAKAQQAIEAVGGSIVVLNNRIKNAE